MRKGGHPWNKGHIVGRIIVGNLMAKTSQIMRNLVNNRVAVKITQCILIDFNSYYVYVVHLL